MADKEKPRPINRLRTVKDVRPIVDKMYQEGVEATASGKPIAWAMVNWWHADPILKAMDFTVIYPENYGAACAAAGAAPEYLGRCESEGFPTHLCGYARNGIGYSQKMVESGEIPPDAPMGGMAKPTLMVGSTLFCDARFKWFQALQRYWRDVPLWVMEVPQPKARESLMEGVEDYVITFMVQEMRDFVSFLEKLTGEKINWDILSEVVQTTEKVLATWYEINDLRRAVPCPMHSRDFWTMVVPAFYRAGEEDSLKLYEKVLAEVKERVAGHVGAIGTGTPEEEKYRLAFVELPPWHSMKFFDRLAEKGWNFVIETWNYHPPPPPDMGGINDPLERIARLVYWYYTNNSPSTVTEGRTASAMVEPYIQYAGQYKLDGAVIHPLISCRCNAVYPLHVRDVLEHDAAIPSLVAPGDIVDFSVFNEVEVLGQADAFIEIMDYYREKRRR